MKRPAIITPRFVIRPLTTSDVTDRYLGWLQDVVSNRFIVTADSKHSLQSLQEYVKIRLKRKDVLFLGIFSKKNDYHIGNIKFEPIDYPNHTAVMGLLIGDTDWRGQGVSVEVINACAGWLFKNSSITHIYLGVDEENTAAIRAYIKAGFRIKNDSVSNSNPRGGLMMVRIHSPNLRLALGTVQFGLPYGISNTSGKVSNNEVRTILEHAWVSGIGTLDTAVLYGDSEQILGECGVDQWQVISKLPAIPDTCDDVESWTQEVVTHSLERLKIDNLYGLLLHRPQQLLEHQGHVLYRALIRLKKLGLVKKIGISIYNPSELEILQPQFQLDLVQAPFNVLDRRLLNSGWLTRLHQAGIEVHVRSIFLQGLLLMEEDKRPEKFFRWHPLWNQWYHWLKEEKLTPVEACLGFVLSYPEIDRIVFGVESVKQLEEILFAAEKMVPMPPATLMTEDVDLINPSKWEYL